MNARTLVSLLLMLLLGALPALAQTPKAPAPAPAPASAPEGGKTITVTAEGLADPNADTYKRDKGLLLDDLRADARRQVIEKAVGSYMETSTLMQNYTLVHDKVLSRSKGIIKRVVKESQPWVGEDGFAHLMMTAEVYAGELKDTLSEMGRQERVSLIKDAGNPRIAVTINIRDAERGVDIKPERSEVAENILKERIKGFGYRVWSSGQAGQADFTISGEAKFKTVSAKLAASGLTLTKYVLTSWSVKCVDNHTGEEIYFNNKVPQKQSWPDEDQAIKEIGQLIGGEFSKEFFEEQLQAPARTFQVKVLGLPSYDTAQLLRKEFIGLRPGARRGAAGLRPRRGLALRDRVRRRQGQLQPVHADRNPGPAEQEAGRGGLHPGDRLGRGRHRGLQERQGREHRRAPAQRAPGRAEPGRAPAPARGGAVRRDQDQAGPGRPGRGQGPER